ncbi:MAG: DUF3793 family protein [Clostridiales bacterium]|jgi:hypothetical protein|nr:DUF3793 family protein [Clostridiales bacterium]
MNNTIRFFKTLRTRQSGAEYLQSLFLYSASPVLKQIKPAVFLSVPYGGKVSKAACARAQTAVRAETALRVKTLYKGNSCERLLLYNAALLSDALNDAEAAALLRRLGYPRRGTAANLAYLAARFSREKCPHEIGLFLGYPPGDVGGFIAHKGADCLLCGAWKVYGNIDYAKRKWTEWAKAREAMASLLLNGVPNRAALAADFLGNR